MRSRHRRIDYLPEEKELAENSSNSEADDNADDKEDKADDQDTEAIQACSSLPHESISFGSTLRQSQADIFKCKHISSAKCRGKMFRY